MAETSNHRLDELLCDIPLGAHAQTVRDAIHLIERLRVVLGSAVIMIDKLKLFGDDNVQRYDVAPWRAKVLEEFPDLPNAWHP